MILCRTTVKKKSRRIADRFSCAFEAVALIFRAAASFLSITELTTTQNINSGIQEDCRYGDFFVVVQHTQVTFIKKSIAPPPWESDFEYELTRHIYSTVISHALIFILKWVYFFIQKCNCTPCPVGTKSEKGERSRNFYQFAPFQGWKGGEQ